MANNNMKNKNYKHHKDFFTRVSELYIKQHYNENGKHDLDLLVDFDEIPIGPYPNMCNPSQILFYMKSIYREPINKKSEKDGH